MLTRVAIELAQFLTQPRIVSAMRVVMGIAERMPELGRRFYDTGPCFSRNKLAAYFDRRVAAGQLDIPDTLLAAAQFLEMSHSPVLKPMLFGATGQPTAERIARGRRAPPSRFSWPPMGAGASRPDGRGRRA